MSTLRKIDSARANGAKSHGPHHRGRPQNLLMNAIKNGLNARTPCCSTKAMTSMPLLDSYIQDLQPVGTAEMEAVVDMVNAKWRQRRL